MDKTQTQVIDWLANGEVGISSNTMAFWLAFEKTVDDSSHPHDPADLDRCLKLLQRAPLLRAQLPKMAQVSREWAALVARWDEVERSHLDEVGLGWTKAHSAPKTYKLMREVLIPVPKMTTPLDRK
jgi:hypothetical protein